MSFCPSEAGSNKNFCLLPEQLQAIQKAPCRMTVFILYIAHLIFLNSLPQSHTDKHGLKL